MIIWVNEIPGAAAAECDCGWKTGDIPRRDDTKFPLKLAALIAWHERDTGHPWSVRGPDGWEPAGCFDEVTA